MTRRLQTLAALLVWSSQPAGITLFCFLLWIHAYTRYLMIAYAIYIAYENLVLQVGKTGSRRSETFRRSSVWKYFRDYFPISLVKTTDLDPKQSYVFGYFPHGIIGLGAYGNFITEATNFSEVFPGLRLHLLVLNLIPWVPFARELCLMGGGCNVDRGTCLHLLRKGRSICILVGGAKEALDAHPNTMKLTVLNRLGFVRIAVETGSSLVPVISFGENEIFRQLPNPKGSLLRRFQEGLQKYMGFSIPTPYGRGIFQYDYGILPFRHPVSVVVGAPIVVPKEEKPSDDTVARLHKEYVQALKELFDAHKNKYYPEGSVPEIEFQ